MLKKRKSKIFLLMSSSVIIASSSIGTLLYNIDFNKNQHSFIYDDKAEALLNKSNNLSFDNSLISNKDQNLKEKPNKIVEIIEKPEKPTEQPIVILSPPKEKPKIETPKPAPSPIPKVIETQSQPIVQEPPKTIPPVSTPEPTPKPKPSGSETLVQIAGVYVKAKVNKKIPPRIISNYDKENGLANREPYINNFVGEIISVEVTDELREANKRQALTGIQRNVGIFINTFIEDKEFYDQNGYKSITIKNYWGSIWDRFGRLIEVIMKNKNDPFYLNFLKKEAAEVYPTKDFNNDIDEEKAWLVIHLDTSKFNTLNPESENYLKTGYSINQDNVYINEKGEIGSYSHGLPAEFNGVLSRMYRDNNEKRAFTYDSAEWRFSGAIQEGKYPGWTKTDISQSPEFSKYNVSNVTGIKIFSMQRDTPIEGKRNQGYVVEIDTSKNDAYTKTKQLIEELKADNKEITSYRFFNMGKNDSSQKFRDILSALPEKLPQLELFFDASATNTSSLIALEDKYIDELSLYTLGNSLLDSWSLNPWAIKRTAWVNSIDYNVSFNFKKNTDVATRLTIDTLAFEETDYLKGHADPYKRINDGLRIVYYTRNNEPFFQGGFGPGLKPDHDEGNNSYPMGLDFSRAKSIKSLKGLIFHDIEKPQNKARKLRRLTLFNDSDTFSISALELNKAGFKDHMILDGNTMPPTKIMFSNEGITKYVRITGLDELNSEGITNLSVLFNLSKGLNRTEIKIDSQSSKLGNQLKSLGYQVSMINQDDEYTIT